MSFTSKPTYIPEFATTDYTDPGGRVNVTEPPTDKKEKGWQYLEKPGMNYMNWVHRGNYRWINYFNQFWNSSHQFLINEIDSEGGAGISVLDTIKVDVINEYTASAGVTIEGITLLDGYINEPLGIKVAPVAGTNLHVHQADSAASLSHFTNLTTGATATDGFDVGLDASEQGRIWNYENTDLIIGTNNIAMLQIAKADSGSIGILNGIPLIIYSAGNDKYLSLIHNDTDALISTNSGNIYTDKSFGIGVVPSNQLHIQSATPPQVRISYDASNYATFRVSSAGNLTITPTGNVLSLAATTIQALAGSVLWMYSSDNAEYGLITHNGSNLNISTGGTTAGNIVISNTTESTSKDTGAFIVEGGIGAEKNIVNGGYLKSGLGRWPINGVYAISATQNSVFDTLSPYIPNINDEIIIHGAHNNTSNTYIISKAIRTSNTEITFYGLSTTGSYTTITCTDGSSSGGSWNISW